MCSFLDPSSALLSSPSGFCHQSILLLFPSAFFSVRVLEVNRSSASSLTVSVTLSSHSCVDDLAYLCVFQLELAMSKSPLAKSPSEGHRSLADTTSNADTDKQGKHTVWEWFCMTGLSCVFEHTWLPELVCSSPSACTWLLKAPVHRCGKCSVYVDKT